MTIFYVPLYDVWAMGFALTVAIALFATLFVVPFAIVWFVASGVGNAVRWSTKRTSGALRVRGHALRHGQTLGVTLPRDR
jgi:hypothetical protein